MDGMPKTMFLITSRFNNSRVEVWYFSEALVLFLIFAALQTGLKIECSSKVRVGILIGTRKKGWRVGGKNWGVGPQ